LNVVAIEFPPAAPPGAADAGSDTERNAPATHIVGRTLVVVCNPKP
jgi:hypothetical protein